MVYPVSVKCPVSQFYDHHSARREAHILGEVYGASCQYVGAVGGLTYDFGLAADVH